MANLNSEALSQMPVWVPALEAQLHIVQLLSNLEKAILLREKLWGLKSAFRETLLRDLLAKGEKNLLLPNGWQTCELGDLCRMVNGNRFHRKDWSDQGMPIVRIRNLNGSQNFKYFAGYAKPAWRVEPGDLLLPWAGSVESVRPYLWRGPQGVLNQHIFKLVPRDGVEQRWLYEVLRTIAPQLQRLSQGFKENMVHLHKEDVSRYPIAVPPPEEQMQIARWSRQLEESLDQRNSQLELLKQLQRGLRNDLFSGRKNPPFDKKNL
jgi:type I restriction enzyme S subunit